MSPPRQRACRPPARDRAATRETPAPPYAAAPSHRHAGFDPHDPMGLYGPMGNAALGAQLGAAGALGMEPMGLAYAPLLGNAAAQRYLRQGQQDAGQGSDREVPAQEGEAAPAQVIEMEPMTIYGQAPSNDEASATPEPATEGTIEMEPLTLYGQAPAHDEENDAAEAEGHIEMEPLTLYGRAPPEQEAPEGHIEMEPLTIYGRAPQTEVPSDVIEMEPITIYGRAPPPAQSEPQAEVEGVIEMEPLTIYGRGPAGGEGEATTPEQVPTTETPAPEQGAAAEHATEAAQQATEEGEQTEAAAETALAQEGAEAQAEQAAEDTEASGEEAAASIEVGPEAEQGDAALAAGGGGAGEADADLRAWRSQVSADTNAVPQPELGEAAEGHARVRERGAGLREARAPARRRIPREARNAVSNPPEVEDPPPPPEPNPVPEATQRVADKSDRRLPEQSMPDLQASPRGTQPRSGDRPMRDEAAGGGGAGGARVTVTLRRVEAGEARAEQSPEQEQAEQLRQQRETRAPETEREGSSEGVTLTDEPPEPSPPLPEAAKSVITSVLARLLANPQAGAERILMDARKAAYNNEELNHVYPDIGNEQLAGLTESITSELRTVATEAGVAGNELDTAISARTQELEAQRQQAEGAINDATGDERDALTESGQEETDLVAGAREAVDLNTEQQMEAANGEGDPAVVRAKRDRLQRNIDRTVGQQRVAYTQAKDRRRSQIDRASRDQRLAYAAATQTDERAILAAHRAAAEEPEPVPLAVRLQMTAARGWGSARERELRRTVFQMKQQADTWAEDYRSEVSAAGDQARELIQAWADKRLGTERSWWQRLWARIRSWFTQAQAESEAWEVARAGDTRDAILGDFVMLNQYAGQHGDEVDLSSEGALQGLERRAEGRGARLLFRRARRPQPHRRRGRWVASTPVAATPSATH